MNFPNRSYRNNSFNLKDAPLKACWLSWGIAAKVRLRQRSGLEIKHATLWPAKSGGRANRLMYELPDAYWTDTGYDR